MTNTDLRQMVRDILREVVPPKGAAASGVEAVSHCQRRGSHGLCPHA